MKKLLSKILGFIFSQAVESITELSSDYKVGEFQRIPQGLKERPVYLWNINGKNYGKFPLVQAERIARHHHYFMWSIDKRKPNFGTRHLHGIIPIIFAAFIIAEIVRNIPDGDVCEPNQKVLA